MRDSRGESGRLLIVVVLLVGLSGGVVYWKRVEGAPERFFQEGLEAHSQRAYPRGRPRRPWGRLRLSPVRGPRISGTNGVLARESRLGPGSRLAR